MIVDVPENLKKKLRDRESKIIYPAASNLIFFV